MFPLKEGSLSVPQGTIHAEEEYFIQKHERYFPAKNIFPEK